MPSQFGVVERGNVKNVLPSGKKKMSQQLANTETKHGDSSVGQEGCDRKDGFGFYKCGCFKFKYFDYSDDHDDSVKLSMDRQLNVP
ncbi:hypothetical protein WN944_012474 [Citrus x changshan-huyou]|uniref:Uncharacterized protein n=1 Tax=Citrus x changshan-huyou TaxID=2935761 RepID=A0AAP0MV91_9ROSI